MSRFRALSRAACTMGQSKCIHGLLGVPTNTMQALTKHKASGKILTTRRHLLPSAHHNSEQGELAARQEKTKRMLPRTSGSRGSHAAPPRAAPADAMKLSMNSSRPALGTNANEDPETSKWT